jgi:23S rRNA pseudouridine2604 synthase
MNRGRSSNPVSRPGSPAGTGRRDARRPRPADAGATRPRTGPASAGRGYGRPVRPAAAAPGEERISKLLASRGLASRREADEWIAAGWVRVDGQMAVLGQRVAPDAVIEIDARAAREQARQVTVLLHKPVGYVSGQPEDGHPSAAELYTPGNRWSEDRSWQSWHPGQLRGLAPAGRLDIDSTGLLVLTQDGRIARALIGAHSPIEKEYLVRVAYGDPARGRPAQQFPESDLARLRHGLELDGQALRPAKVSWQNEDQLRFVLREGRKRQIRRMCELVGLRVLGLKRVRIGSVPLGRLPAGQWRYLGEGERFG